MSSCQKVHIIGAGLAGSEAAWQIASRNIPVILHEMRPKINTAAHQTAKCAELVCSNSFRSDDHQYNNALYLSKKGAAEIIESDILNSESLFELLIELENNKISNCKYLDQERAKDLLVF